MFCAGFHGRLADVRVSSAKTRLKPLEGRRTPSHVPGAQFGEGEAPAGPIRPASDSKPGGKAMHQMLSTCNRKPPIDHSPALARPFTGGGDVGRPGII